MLHCKEETLKPEPGQVKNVVLSSGVRKIMRFPWTAVPVQCENYAQRL